MQTSTRTRQGKSNIFKKDWDKGHDPLKAYIEEEDSEGKIVKRNPVSKTYNIYEMKYEDLDDFLGDDEKAAMESALKHKRECGHKDICREKREELENIEKERIKRISILEEREKIWLQDAKNKEKEFAQYKSDTDAMLADQSRKIEKLATLVAQLLKK